MVLYTLPKQLGGESKDSEPHPQGVEGFVEGAEERGKVSIEDFILSIWSLAWERAPGWLKSCLVALGRCSGRSPDTRGMHGVPLKAAGLEAPSPA